MTPQDGTFTLADEGATVGVADYTGRHLVLLDTDGMAAGLSALSDRAGVSAVESISASDPEAVTAAIEAGSSFVLDEIGVAVITVEADQRQSLLQAATQAPEVLAVEQERILSIFNETLSTEFLRGYRAGVDALVDQALNPGAGSSTATAGPRIDWDETHATWGLQASRVTESCHTADGVRMAVLDTGMDLTHPDFAGRAITTASFIPGEATQDGHGHGTHCIGTSCGPKQPGTLPRYGVASGAAIYAGKVLSNAGRGADSGILAGINWAVAQRCRVVSMSLGAPTNVGDTYSRIYEHVAQRALAKGTVIVAAAGNESRRPGTIRPVGHPANCPSIMAVAALARDLTVAWFSCAGLNPAGGQVDIAAPGVDVLSSWPEPTRYKRISGTSMATPHVAGALAVLSGAHPNASPAELKNILLADARRLSLPSTDVGSGLLQAR